jgi:hypothetical protein
MASHFSAFKIRTAFSLAVSSIADFRSGVLEMYFALAARRSW